MLPPSYHKDYFLFGDTSNKNIRIFKDPILKAFCHEGKSWLEWKDGKINSYNDPLEALDQILRIQKERNLYLTLAIAYEFGNIIEILNSPKSENYLFPTYAIYGFSGECDKSADLSSLYLNHPTSSTIPFSIEELANFSDWSKADYVSAGLDIISQITEGQVYQVNLSQNFVLPYSKSPWEFFRNLAQQHPSPYSCFFNLTSDFINLDGTIVSNSPELFIKKVGQSLVTRPIKGTRTRGLSALEDLSLKQELMTSQKDLAELSMIVDLERNDLGKISQINSVEVISHAVLEEYSNVFHLVSEIHSKLLDSVSFIDILKAVFPCGSITGAPKIASQNVISSKEKSKRNIYTGSLGIIEPNSDFVLSVAIRTGFISNESLFFSAGGGIVIESDPELEYLETLAKASAFYSAWVSTK